MSIIIGIDPGQSGAVAIWQVPTWAQNITWSIAITPTTEIGGWSIHDTPTIDIGTKNKPRTDYNVPAMAALMPDTSGGPIHAFIESVNAMPRMMGAVNVKMGAASSFHFGKGFGIWLGILGTLAIPYTLVWPRVWKKDMLAGRNKEKDASRLRALELFPHLADELQLKKHHNRADALLIAEWGRRQGR